MQKKEESQGELWREFSSIKIKTRVRLLGDRIAHLYGKGEGKKTFVRMGQLDKEKLHLQRGGRAAQVFKKLKKVHRQR